ncbi:hypothetical protein N8Z33_01290 [Flavobacteriaceae bacterium]|nr:hypothetical protein [Flavobacteriaceae bacterium]
MKIEILLFVFLINCGSSNLIQQKKEFLGKNFTDVTELISSEEFERVKEFVLKNGGKMTYRNFDSNNPHYKFSNCDVYFGADVGQKNINNDPKISDFNQLTIADWDSDIRYYELIIVRKGDLKVEKTWIEEGMKEQYVYLVDVYGKKLELMRKSLTNYLMQIKEEITTTNNVYKK